MYLRLYTSVFCVFLCTVAAMEGAVGQSLVIRGEVDLVLDEAFGADRDIVGEAKITMRFGDSASQITAVRYGAFSPRPGTSAELIVQSVVGLGGAPLSDVIGKMAVEIPSASRRDIASRLQVSVRRVAMNPAVLNEWLNELGAIRVSPAVPGRIAVDSAPSFELVYQSGSQFSHFYLVGLPRSGAEDEVVRWMFRVRNLVAQTAAGS